MYIYWLVALMFLFLIIKLEFTETTSVCKVVNDCISRLPFHFGEGSALIEDSSGQWNSVLSLASHHALMSFIYFPKQCSDFSMFNGTAGVCCLWTKVQIRPSGDTWPPVPKRNCICNETAGKCLTCLCLSLCPLTSLTCSLDPPLFTLSSILRLLGHKDRNEWI